MNACSLTPLALALPLLAGVATAGFQPSETEYLREPVPPHEPQRNPAEELQCIRDYIALLQDIERVLAAGQAPADKAAALTALRPRAHAMGAKLTAFTPGRISELRRALGDRDGLYPVLTQGRLRRQKEGIDGCTDELLYLLGEAAHAEHSSCDAEGQLSGWLRGKRHLLCGSLTRVEAGSPRFLLRVPLGQGGEAGSLSVRFTLAGGQECADALERELDALERPGIHRKLLLRYREDTLRRTEEGYELEGVVHRCDILTRSCDELERRLACDKELHGKPLVPLDEYFRHKGYPALRTRILLPQPSP